MLDILTPTFRKLVMTIIVLSILFLIFDITLQYHLVLTEKIIDINQQGWISCPADFDSGCMKVIRQIDLLHVLGAALISYVIACLLEATFPAPAVRHAKSKSTSRSKRRR